MRILIFLCTLCVLALAFASPVPEDKEEEINKRLFSHRFTFFPNYRIPQKLIDGVVNVTKNVTMGFKKVGQLVTKDGIHFGTLFVKPTGDALLKFSKVVYKLNRGVFLKAKKTFEKRVKNVKFEDVLYKLFPLMKASYKGCKEAVSIAVAALGGSAAAKAAEPVHGEVCKIREHIVSTLKKEITHG